MSRAYCLNRCPCHLGHIFQTKELLRKNTAGPSVLGKGNSFAKNPVPVEMMLGWKVHISGPRSPGAVPFNYGSSRPSWKVFFLDLQDGIGWQNLCKMYSLPPPYFKMQTWRGPRPTSEEVANSWPSIVLKVDLGLVWAQRDQLSSVKLWKGSENN